MTAPIPNPPSPIPLLPYRCPGDVHPISRSVHLGRLARFHAACRTCPRRDDTAPLSGRQVRRLQETIVRGQPPSLLTEEAIVGQAGQITPELVERLARAWGLGLQNVAAAPGVPSPGAAPLAVVGGDGRPLTAPLAAAAIHGLRWSGCHVVDAGDVSGPCLVYAIDHFGATGGLLLGNPPGRAGTCGLKFWAGGRMLGGAALADLLRRSDEPADRPTRTFGSLRRAAGDEPYLDGLAEHFHALRPLRFVIDVSSPPVNRFLSRFTNHTACRVVPLHSGQDLSAAVLAQRAHFGISITDDGSRCQLIDDRGTPVSAADVARILADAAPSPAAPTPDALQTLSRLLVALSRDDRRLSALVSAAATANSR